MIDRNTNVDTTTEALAFAKPMLAEVPLVVSFSGGRTSAFMARQIFVGCRLAFLLMNR